MVILYSITNNNSDIYYFDNYNNKDIIDYKSKTIDNLNWNNNSAIEYLKDGHLINLSPEAKRNYTKEILLPFKFGAVVMAKRTNSKIIPYSITGDYKFRSKNLKIVFGKPLDISKLSVEDANALLYKKVKKLIMDNRK